MYTGFKTGSVCENLKHMISGLDFTPNETFPLHILHGIDVYRLVDTHIAVALYISTHTTYKNDN